MLNIILVSCISLVFVFVMIRIHRNLKRAREIMESVRDDRRKIEFLKFKNAMNLLEMIGLLMDDSKGEDDSKEE